SEVELLWVVPRDERYLRGDVPMRDRNTRGRRDGRDRRDAGHDLEVDPRFGERERLLSAPPEDEGISSLQADDLEVAPAQRHEQGVDLRLSEGIARDAKGV